MNDDQLDAFISVYDVSHQKPLDNDRRKRLLASMRKAKVPGISIIEKELTRALQMECCYAAMLERLRRKHAQLDNQ